MKTVKCAIIEDEPLGAKSLKSLLKRYSPDFSVVAEAKNLAEAKKILTNDSIELVFADIELLDGNIFDILGEIEFKAGRHIIFTTAYEEFGARAFNFPALHYLLKPINPDELDKAITRFKNAASGEKDSGTLKEKTHNLDFELGKLALPTQNGMLFVNYEEVIRIQSSNKYSIVFTTEGKQHIVSKPLTRFEEVLSDKGFARVHDSHLINLHHIKGYLKGKGGEIIMSDGSHVTVSVRRKDALGSLLKFPL